MTTTSQYDSGKDELERVISEVLQTLSPEALADPNLAQTVQRLVEQRLGSASGNGSQPPPGDGGLADLIGLGASSAKDPGQTVISPGVVDYDDTVVSGRLLATADLYYLAVHDRRAHGIVVQHPHADRDAGIATLQRLDRCWNIALRKSVNHGDLDVINTEEATGGKGLGVVWYENPTR